MHQVYRITSVTGSLHFLFAVFPISDEQRQDKKLSEAG